MLFSFLLICLIASAFLYEYMQKTDFSPRKSLRRGLRKMTFGGQYWTLMTGLGVTNLGTTFTHSLGITPSLLFARVVPHQAVVTNTAPVLVCTIGTNIITFASGVGTLVTCDLEVGMQHSLIS